MKICFIASLLSLALLVLCLSPQAQGLTFQHLGCFKDNWFSRAVPEYLGRFRNPGTAAKQCAGLAMKKGYTTFAMQNSVQCWSGVAADHTYKRYGKANTCRGGVGAAWANDVYQFPMYVLLKKIRSKYTKQARLIKALSNRVRRARVRCHNRVTGWDLYSDATIMYLDRQYVNCPYPYFLSNFVLRRSADRRKAPVRYVYRCCKFVL